MATSSINKSVNIRSAKKCASLVRALEKASIHVAPSSHVSYQRLCTEMSREEIQKYFGDKKDEGVQNRQPT